MPTGSDDGAISSPAVSLDSLESSDLLGQPDVLRHRLAGEGFLFFRGLLPSAVVAEVRAGVLEVIGQEGWLAEGTEPEGRWPGPVVVREGDDRWWGGYQKIQSLECFHRLAYQEPLVNLARDLLGGTVLVHPRKIGRVTFPGSDYPTPPHQDFPLIQGSPDTLTCWLPLAECGPQDGALRVLRRSPSTGLRPPEPTFGVGGLAVPVRPDESEQWVSASYRPGDVLLFHSLTVHWAPSNRGERLRLSCDYRYQLANERVVEGSLLPHYWPTIPGWDVLTEGW
ncbi:MAG TPA: phytanoyl-CoA dioxygenase family protein, partial [Acidimicrobiales bacterium]|nr:phytanoyl-CoA dioxygenase family protein [Acidimicrobiales bacterium]